MRWRDKFLRMYQKEWARERDRKHANWEGLSRYTGRGVGQE